MMSDKGFGCQSFSCQQPSFRFLTLVALLLQSLVLTGADSAALPSGSLTRYPGNPMLRNGPEPYDKGKTGPRVVMKVGPGQYRLWYEAVAGNGVTSVAHAISKDGMKWTKQGLVLTPSLPWEVEEVSPNTVLFEAGVYKLWYHGGGYVRGKLRLGYARIGYATSPDGLTWTKYPGNPVLDIGPSGSWDDRIVAEPRVLRIGNTYRMYYTGQQGPKEKTSLGMAASPDGIHWKKYPGNPILDKERWGDCWGGAFIHENGIWHLWHGAVKPGESGLRYMWSSDGISWADGPTNPVLTQNPDPKAPDHDFLGDSVSGYRDGDTYRIMYTGTSSNLYGKLGRFNGICLATMTVKKTDRRK